MWYEAMPSLLIIGVFVYGSQITSRVVANLFFDKPWKPSLDNVWERNMYERDNRINGVAWKNPEDPLKDVPDL